MEYTEEHAHNTDHAPCHSGDGTIVPYTKDHHGNILQGPSLSPMVGNPSEIPDLSPTEVWTDIVEQTESQPDLMDCPVEIKRPTVVHEDLVPAYLKTGLLQISPLPHDLPIHSIGLSICENVSKGLKRHPMELVQTTKKLKNLG